MKRLILILTALALTHEPARAGFIGTLDEVSPTSLSFVQGVDFQTFGLFNGIANPPALGDVTGFLQAAGFGDSSDFTGFSPGNIALIERGNFIAFSAKVNNAEAAGAIGVLIYDNVSEPIFTGVFASQTTIPALMITQSLGDQFLTELQSSPVEVHMTVEPGVAVPEPASLLLAGIGFLGLLGHGWRRRQQVL